MGRIKVMEKDYLTVKEYATLKGCSTQYVYKLLQTKLNNYVKVVNGKKCLKISVLDEGAESVATKVANQVDNQVCNQVASPSASADEEELKRINRRNEDIIDELRAQVKEKDAQIQKQNDQIVELSNRITELFENNQKLQLNYQYLLGDIKEKEVEEVNIEVDAEGARAQEEPEPIPEEEPKKRSFFSRLFNL